MLSIMKPKNILTAYRHWQQYKCISYSYSY